jgi:iron(III) transport system substrate-binding protein
VTGAGRRRQLFGLLLAAALGACTRAPATTVVVYTSEDQVFAEPILRDFERSSGIAVRAVYDTEETKSTGVALRIVAERGRPQADVFWGNEPLRAVMLKREGLLQPYVSPGRRGIPARYRDSEGYWTGFAARARVIVYNTRQVRPAEAPSSVDALIDPRWRGRAGLANPLFGTTTTHIAALFKLWGEHRAKSFLLAVKRNGVKIVTSNGEARDLVAAGAIAWAFCDTDDANVALEQKKPVAVIYPDQGGLGTLVMPNVVAMVKGATHPEMARKLIDYLLSPSVEEHLAASPAAQMPLHPSVPVPPAVKPASAIKAMAVRFDELGPTTDEILPILKEWAGSR